MKQVIVRPAAAADIDDAYQWYEAKRSGLGEEFLVALNATRDRVVEQPEAYPVLQRATRRALIPKRFPYGLFYRVYGDTMSSSPACMQNEIRGDGNVVRDGEQRVRPDRWLACARRGRST